MTEPHEAADVLDHHDRVVDQEPQRDHEPDDAELVDGEAGQVQHGEPDRQRERDRDHHDQRGPQPERQQREQDQGDGEAKVAQEALEPVPHILGLIEADLETDAGRQLLGVTLELGLEKLAGVVDVLAFLLVGGDEDRPLPVVAADVGQVGVLDGHLGDVAQVDDAALAVGHDGVLDLVERGVIPRGLNVEFLVADVDAAGRDVDVGGLQRPDDLLWREPQRREPRQVERDPHFLIGIGPLAGFLHTRHVLEPLLQAVGTGLELAVGGRGRDQRCLDDVDVGGVELVDVELLQARRQGGPHRVHLAQHVVVLLVGVDARRELGGQHRQPVVDLGLETLDVVEGLDLLLERIDHQLLEIGGGRAGIDRDHQKGGDRKGRVFGLGNADQRIDAQADQQQEDDDGELVALDREARNRHGKAPFLEC